MKKEEQNNNNERHSIVTSNNTLVHNLKFKVEKAFLIVSYIL